MWHRSISHVLRPRPAWAALVVTLFSSAHLAAQTAYRCESSSPAGRKQVQYQAQPCDAASLPSPGPSRGPSPLHLADRRTPAQQADAAKATQASAALGQQMERERLAQEKRAARGPSVARIHHSQAHQSVASKPALVQDPPLKRPRHFRAKVPRSTDSDRAPSLKK